MQLRFPLRLPVVKLALFDCYAAEFGAKLSFAYALALELHCRAGTGAAVRIKLFCNASASGELAGSASLQIALAAAVSIRGRLPYVASSTHKHVAGLLAQGTCTAEGK